MKHETGNRRIFLGYLFALTLALTMLFGMTLTAAAAKVTNAEVMSRYKVDAEGKTGDNYIIYCLGTDNWDGSQDNYTQAQVDALSNYLENVEDEGRPIIILTHFPLHICNMGGNSWGGYGGRQTTNANKVIGVLNNAVSNGKTIVLLWGHNHSYSDTYYDQIFKPDTSLQYASGSSETINFIYAAAGCMSDDEYGSGSHSVKGKGLIITIDNTTRDLDFHYFDGEGNDVTENDAGQAQSKPFNVENPGAGKTVLAFTSDIHNKGSVDSTNTSVYRLKTWLDREKVRFDHIDLMGFCGDMGNGSAGENDFWTLTDNVMNTVSDEEIEGVYTTGNHEFLNGKFKRDAQGSGEQGEQGDIPTGDVTVTPAPSNSPDVSRKIEIGETLVIDVKNGSSRSAYDFDATLSKDGVAQLDKDTVNIAAGGTGQFTVTGLEDGVVTITIQNNNSSSNRKAYIRLTVGNGGGDEQEDPQTGDITITPNANSVPEESRTIKVGDSLVIDVKNASTRSAYDFTATLSADGVVQLDKNLVNIASGGTGQFTVTGLAEGTVDITIQNNNSSSNRQAIIHLTVGEGGTTPDNPTVKTYVYYETDELEAGKDYVVAAVKDENSVYAISYGDGEYAGATPLTVKEDETGKYVEATNSEVWRRNSDMSLTNNSRYCYPGAQDTVRIYTATRAITYSEVEGSTGKVLSFESEHNDPGVTYYVTCDSEGNWASTSKPSEATVFRVFEKTEKTEPITVTTTVTLDPTELNLKVGDEATLNATVTPDTVAIVDWNSKDVSVATVNGNGEVTAVAVGSTKITVKTEDGATAECVVNVAKKDEGGNGGNEGGNGGNEGGNGGNEGGNGGNEGGNGGNNSGNNSGNNGNNSGNNSGNNGSNNGTVAPTTKPTQPTAEEAAKAPVDNSLPVIDMDKIKTVASAKKSTMTIGLGAMDCDTCMIEYRKLGENNWTSVWVQPTKEVVLNNMKKNSFYQFRFTTFKYTNNSWKKSKTSNTSYRWIINTKIKKIKAKGKTMTVSWKKVKGAKGYWVQYSTDKTFNKGVKTVKIKGGKKVSKKVKVKKGQTYYVRVRPTQKKSGKNYLGIFTGAKKVKVKKK